MARAGPCRARHRQVRVRPLAALMRGMIDYFRLRNRENGHAIYPVAEHPAEDLEALVRQHTANASLPVPEGAFGLDVSLVIVRSAPAISALAERRSRPAWGLEVQPKGSTECPWCPRGRRAQCGGSRSPRLVHFRCGSALLSQHWSSRGLDSDGDLPAVTAAAGIPEQTRDSVSSIAIRSQRSRRVLVPRDHTATSGPDEP